jgi:hypothetical protein
MPSSVKKARMRRAWTPNSMEADLPSGMIFERPNSGKLLAAYSGSPCWLRKCRPLQKETDGLHPEKSIQTLSS